MHIKFPRVITKRTIERYKSQAKAQNREFVCSRCGKPFNVGDKIYKFRSKGSRYCCEDCYKEMLIDIPDSILEDNEKLFIETGNIEYLGGEILEKENTTRTSQ